MVYDSQGDDGIIREEGAIRCINAACPAQLERRITHFASKPAMAIDGMGPRTVKLLLEASLISDVADIYNIKKEDITSLPGMGDLSADNLLSAIDVNDIRDVKVLKNGAAIYGARAANGVIIIETKRGESMATRITANVFANVTAAPSTPDMLNADE